MPRPRRGERRIDAAIDHLSVLGFPKPLIRRTINQLLQIYGRDGWVFLEEGSYRVVIERLLEEQAQEEEEQQQLEQQGREAVTAAEAPPINDTPSEVSQHAIEEANAPAIALPDLRPAVPFSEPFSVPFSVPIAKNSVLPTRPPCYGWISDSDSESDLDNANSDFEFPKPPDVPNHEINFPMTTTGGGMLLPPKRRRPTRWDVPPSY